MANGITRFLVAALRSLVTLVRWRINGAEMLGLGVVVAAVAYRIGRLVAGRTG